ncbi:MAG TPA: guanylate kinase [Victivallales bacterium]|nr:guanylate kinase [Victivallales bacterium]
MKNNFDIKSYRSLGILLIVSGASGAGKSTICKPIMEKNGFDFSVSCTTRKPREGEVDGKDYYFIGKDNFREKVEVNEFIEHAVVHGNFYGTLKSEIHSRVLNNQNILLDIDVQGALQVKEYIKSDEILTKCAEFVFILPPSLDELKRRLKARGTETDASLKLRLGHAGKEIEKFLIYDYFIVNDDLEEAIDNMQNIVSSLSLKTKRLVEK